MSDVIQKYYDLLLNASFSQSGKISVASSFHGQMRQINNLFNNDKTALISTIIEYMVNSATIDINFEAPNKNLTKVFSQWKQDVNANINIDIPRGLRSFTEQYFRERWKSSFIVVRIKWGNIDGFIVPTRLWLMDGASIYVKNEKGNLNTNEYFLGKPNSKKTNVLKSSDIETVLVRKPYNSLYDLYPVPYLVKKGALYHALFRTQVLERQAEIINTAFPYQLFIKAGCEEAMRRGQMPTKEDLDALMEKFQSKKNDFNAYAFSKGLTGAFPFDVNFEEKIPDYLKALDEKILKGTDRSLLNALGMIELKGFSNTREEAILNPKVLIEEVTNSVSDYVDLLQEIVYLIQEKNSSKYTMNDKVEVAPGIIESFVTDGMRTFIRSIYDRGLVSQEETLESTTPLKFKTQVIKRKKENIDKLPEVMYPRVTQNLEKDPADLTPNNENQDDIPDDKKPGTPESKNYKNACIEIDCITEPMKTIRSIPYEIKKELSHERQQVFKTAFNEKFAECTELEYDDYLREKTSMEYAVQKALEYIEAPYNKNSDLPESVKKALPTKAQAIFRNAFNLALKQGKSEEVAFKIAWGAVKKVYKKNKDGKWIKK